MISIPFAWPPPLEVTKMFDDAEENTRSASAIGGEMEKDGWKKFLPMSNPMHRKTGEASQPLDSSSTTSDVLQWKRFVRLLELSSQKVWKVWVLTQICTDCIWHHL